jgi:hypothetical protein
LAPLNEDAARLNRSDRGGGFENYFRELGELVTSGSVAEHAVGSLHETPEFVDLAKKYGLTYGTPDWTDDVVSRYGLTPPSD